MDPYLPSNWYLCGTTRPVLTGSCVDSIWSPTPPALLVLLPAVFPPNPEFTPPPHRHFHSYSYGPPPKISTVHHRLPSPRHFCHFFVGRACGSCSWVRLLHRLKLAPLNSPADIILAVFGSSMFLRYYLRRYLRGPALSALVRTGMKVLRQV